MAKPAPLPVPQARGAAAPAPKGETAGDALAVSSAWVWVGAATRHATVAAQRAAAGVSARRGSADAAQGASAPPHAEANGSSGAWAAGKGKEGREGGNPSEDPSSP